MRQRDADLEGSGPNVAVRDRYGVAHTYVGEPPPGDGRVVTWAAEVPEVRAWARPLLAAGHRVEATGYRTGGDGATATWDYAATTAATPACRASAPPRARPSSRCAGAGSSPSR